MNKMRRAKIAVPEEALGNKINTVGPALTSRGKWSNPEDVIPLEGKDFKNF